MSLQDLQREIQIFNIKRQKLSSLHKPFANEEYYYRYDIWSNIKQNVTNVGKSISDSVKNVAVFVGLVKENVSETSNIPDISPQVAVSLKESSDMLNNIPKINTPEIVSSMVTIQQESNNISESTIRKVNLADSPLSGESVAIIEMENSNIQKSAKIISETVSKLSSQNTTDNKVLSQNTTDNKVLSQNTTDNKYQHPWIIYIIIAVLILVLVLLIRFLIKIKTKK